MVQLRLRLLVVSRTQYHVSTVAYVKRMLKIPNQIVARTFFFYNAEFYGTLMHLLPGDTFCVSTTDICDIFL